MAEGLRSRGHDVAVWQYGEPGFGFSVDRIIEPNNDPAVYMQTFVEALAEDFDVVHFHFARSLIPARDYLPWFWDLPVWRSLGVRIVFTFHGTDVRLRSHHLADDQWSFYRYGDVPCDEELVAARLSVIRRYAHHLTVGSVLDLPYVPDATYLPKSVDTDRLRLASPPTARRPVILHAPSRRATKGTDLVLEGLEELKTRGLGFDVDLVEGADHRELVERVTRADIVVEKLLGGDAGVSSLEAMALGKVAVARIRAEVIEMHPGLPVVSATPETFVDVMEGLVRDRQRRGQLGVAGRRFVEKEHSHRTTGERLEHLYQARGRTGVPAHSNWTIPTPQKRAETWRARMEKAEEARAAVQVRLESTLRRVDRLEAQLRGFRRT